MALRFWQKILIVLLFIFFLTFLLQGIPAITQDLGRHLKLGEIIWQTKTVPKTNLFSYTEPNHPFVNSHWLSEVVFYLIFKIFSFPGLLVLAAILILGSFVISFFTAFKKSAFWPSFLVSLLAIGVLIERTDVRPEVFSFLLFSFYLFVFFCYPQNLAKKLLWILPILQVFWANLHIYFFLGPLFYFFFFLEKSIRHENLPFRAYLKSSEFKKLALIGLFVILAIFINPNGIKGAFLPFEIARGNYGYSIVENQTPFFLSKFQYHQTILFFFFVVWIILILSTLLNLNNILRQRKIFNLLSCIFVSFFGLYAVRNFPIFALTAIPLISENCVDILPNFKKLLDEIFFEKEFSSLGKIAVFPIIAFLIVGIFYNLPKISFKVPVGSQKAVDFVIENKISGNLFNNYDIGSYLIWRLYPEKKVFVDNRPEAYSVDFLQSVYIPMQENKDSWKIYSEKYGFNFIIFELTDITPWAQTFLSWIITDPDWPLIYKDERTAVFVKRNEINRPLIEKYAL